MVYVISKQGTPLMPTERFGKVRRILKNSLAHVVRRIPFTIQLDYEENPYYVFGRRLSGYFDIRKLDGTKVNNGSISYKKLKLINTQKTLLTERRNSGSIPPRS